MKVFKHRGDMIIYAFLKTHSAYREEIHLGEGTVNVGRPVGNLL